VHYHKQRGVKCHSAAAAARRQHGRTHLSGEALHVVLLRVQRLLRDEDGEVRVLDAHRFDLPVEPGVDLLPHAVRPGPQDVAACPVNVSTPDYSVQPQAKRFMKF